MSYKKHHACKGVGIYSAKGLSFSRAFLVQLYRGLIEIEWMTIVIDSEEMWTDAEYKRILEDKLVHLATGTDEQKQQAKELWEKTAQSKISSSKKSIIEKGIAEIEKTENDENDEDISEQ